MATIGRKTIKVTIIQLIALFVPIVPVYGHINCGPKDNRLTVGSQWHTLWVYSILKSHSYPLISHWTQRTDDKYFVNLSQNRFSSESQTTIKSDTDLEPEIQYWNSINAEILITCAKQLAVLTGNAILIESQKHIKNCDNSNPKSRTLPLLKCSIIWRQLCWEQ